MAQVRLTEFFSQRKKGASGPKKPAGPPSSPVHREFVRVIAEAAGREDRTANAAKAASSPQTPKRPSGLSPERGSAAAEHSSAKRTRRVQAGGGEPAPDTRARRGARKKLVLPDDDTRRSKNPFGGAQAQVLCKEDLAALKCRLQKIKKQVEAVPPAASSSVTPADVHNLQARLVLAKQLSAKVQKSAESEEKPGDALTQDSAERPAYQRYHTLAQDIPPGLVLPLHFRLLAEMFRSMDTVVAMLYNRCETATFAKVQQGVQDMTHRRFEQNHVAQIRTVFPEAYALKQEKNIPTFSSGIKKGEYQLTVEPIIVSDHSQARPVLSASLLLERRRVFHQNLISLVKQHHQEFLSSLVPPVSVPEDRLTRWHPRFNVDLVPAVPVSPLPEPPHRETLSTAQEVLDRARLLINPKMEKALISAAQQVQPRPAQGSVCAQKAAEPVAPVPGSLKGVSQSLLDRIRAKEAQKLQAVMTRDPAHEERLLMMSRLVDLARILRGIFVAEKKAALTMAAACSRMVASYASALTTGENRFCGTTAGSRFCGSGCTLTITPFQTGDMEKHVRLLAELAADWLTLHPIRKDVYLKMDRKVELAVVLDKLSRRLREEEQV
uniref:Chromatin licensing and DNA replication factor 1 n=1 Tax=Oryzias latipes TaxID=8090 RepID=A0A3B3HTS3_ORYLA